MSDNITTHQRVMNMVVRGRLTHTDDATGMQFTQLDLLRDEAKARVEHLQPYGFAANPPPGSEAVGVCVGGGRDHMVILAIGNRRSRIRGQDVGEVAMYSDEGDFIRLKRGNQIELGTDTLIIRAEVEIIIEAPQITIEATQITIKAPNINVEGTIHHTGNINLTGDLNVSGTVSAAAVRAS